MRIVVAHGRTCGCSTGPATRRPSRASWPVSHASTDARQAGSSQVRVPVGIVSRSGPGAASAALAATEQGPEHAADQVLAEPRRDHLATGPDGRVDRLLLGLRGVLGGFLLRLAL